MGFAYLNNLGSLRPHGTNKKIKSHGFFMFAHQEIKSNKQIKNILPFGTWAEIRKLN